MLVRAAQAGVGKFGHTQTLVISTDGEGASRLRRSGEIGKVSPAMLMQGVLFKAAGCIFFVFVHARRLTRSTRVGRTWPKTAAGKCGFKTEHEENTVNQRRHCNVIGISPLLLSRNAPSPSVEMTKRGVRGEQRGLMLLRLKQVAVRGQILAGVPNSIELVISSVVERPRHCVLMTCRYEVFYPSCGCGFYSTSTNSPEQDSGRNALNQHGRGDLIGISPLLLSRNAPSPSVEMTKRGVRGESEWTAQERKLKILPKLKRKT